MSPERQSSRWLFCFPPLFYSVQPTLNPKLRPSESSPQGEQTLNMRRRRRRTKRVSASKSPSGRFCPEASLTETRLCSSHHCCLFCGPGRGDLSGNGLLQQLEGVTGLYDSGLGAVHIPVVISLIPDHADWPAALCAASASPLSDICGRGADVPPLFASGNQPAAF